MKDILIILATLVLLTQGQRFQQNVQSYRPQQNSFFNKPNSHNTKLSTPAQPQQKSSVSCPEKNGRFPTRTCDG